MVVAEVVSAKVVNDKFQTCQVHTAIEPKMSQDLTDRLVQDAEEECASEEELYEPA